jgi:hypothetical protein
MGGMAIHVSNGSIDPTGLLLHIIRCRMKALFRSFEKCSLLKVQRTFGLLYRFALYCAGVNHCCS